MSTISELRKRTNAIYDTDPWEPDPIQYGPRPSRALVCALVIGVGALLFWGLGAWLFAWLAR